MSGHWESLIPVHWLGTICPHDAQKQQPSSQAPDLPRGAHLTPLFLRLKAKNPKSSFLEFHREERIEKLKLPAAGRAVHCGPGDSLGFRSDSLILRVFGTGQAFLH